LPNEILFFEIINFIKTDEHLKTQKQRLFEKAQRNPGIGNCLYSSSQIELKSESRIKYVMTKEKDFLKNIFTKPSKLI